MDKQQTEKYQKTQSVLMVDKNNNDIPDALEDGTYFDLTNVSGSPQPSGFGKLMRNLFMSWGKQHLRVSKIKNQLTKFEQAQKENPPATKPLPPTEPAKINWEKFRIFLAIDAIVFLGILYYFFLRK